MIGWHCQIIPFQSTPLMRGETCKYATNNTNWLISIHSPHARGDTLNFVSRWMEVKFQSTPLMRGETPARLNIFQASGFQSTPLMRGETWAGQICGSDLQISIHSPHARGDITVLNSAVDRLISIHSPHARGDTAVAGSLNAFDISIHSPHARGDHCKINTIAVYGHFNPLPSCEGRRLQCKSGLSDA